MKKLFSLLFSLFLIPFCSALTSGEGTILFGAVFSIIIVVIFFLVLSIISQNKPMKMFFMGLSFLSLFASIGMGVSILQEFFSDLTKIVQVYGQFYIMLIALIGAGIIGLILYLIVVAVKSFNSYRGYSEEED